MTEATRETVFTLEEITEALQKTAPEAEEVVLNALSQLVASRETEKQKTLLPREAAELVKRYDDWSAWGGYETDSLADDGLDLARLINAHDFDREDPTVKKAAFLSACLYFAHVSWFDFDGWESGTSYSGTPYSGDKAVFANAGVSEEALLAHFQEGLVRINFHGKTEEAIRASFSGRDDFGELLVTEGGAWNATIAPLVDDLRNHLLEMGVAIPAHTDSEIQELLGRRQHAEQLGAELPPKLVEITDPHMERASAQSSE